MSSWLNDVMIAFTVPIKAHIKRVRFSQGSATTKPRCFTLQSHSTLCKLGKTKHRPAQTSPPKEKQVSFHTFVAHMVGDLLLEVHSLTHAHGRYFFCHSTLLASANFTNLCCVGNPLCVTAGCGRGRCGGCSAGRCERGRWGRRR
jgi:hypothetical protein